MNSNVLPTSGRCDAACPHGIEKRHAFFFREMRVDTIRFAWPYRIDIVRYGKYRPKRGPLASRNRDRTAYH